MAQRMAHAKHTVLYEPLAIVHHFVPASRTTWRYFWRKCYFANQGKVEVFDNMQEAASLRAELTFVGRALTSGVLAEMRHVIRGDPYGLARVGTMMAGIGFAGLGHLSGKLRRRWSRQVPAMRLGLGRAHGRNGGTKARISGPLSSGTSRASRSAQATSRHVGRRS